MVLHTIIIWHCIKMKQICIFQLSLKFHETLTRLVMKSFYEICNKIWDNINKRYGNEQGMEKKKNTEEPSRMNYTFGDKKKKVINI